MFLKYFLLLFCCLFFIAFTSASYSKSSGEFYLTSPSFKNNGDIPVKYAGIGAGGKNISIPLEWSNEPSGTAAFMLTIIDYDAPNGAFLHWCIFNIPAHIKKLAENTSANAAPDDSVQIYNDADTIGYFGPQPPKGPKHRYTITIYALSEKLNRLTSKSKLNEVLSTVKSKILGKSVLVGHFGR